MINWKRVAENLNEQLEQRRWSKVDAANKAGVVRNTVEKMLCGEEVRQSSLLKMERALGRSLDPASGSVTGPDTGWTCPEHLQHVAGRYYGLRQSYDDRSRIVSYYVELNVAENIFLFSERQNNEDLNRQKFEWGFEGKVRCSGDIIQLVCDDEDLYRICTFQSGPLKTIGSMPGYIMTTSFDYRGVFPVVSPAMMFRIDDAQEIEEIEEKLGVFDRTAFWDDSKVARFEKVTEDFKREWLQR